LRNIDLNCEIFLLGK